MYIFTANVLSNYLTQSFLIALGCYFLIFLFSRSRKSWWDVMSARKVSYVVKILVILELFLILPLIYCVVSWGSPVVLYSHGLHYYWTFGYGRPVFGIVFICLGIFSDMHALARYLCVIGALVQAAFDAVSSVEVSDYIDQVKNFHASNGNYTNQTLSLYYWRDIASFGCCVLLVLTCLHLACIVGLFQPQLISYPQIAGGEIDRPNVFHEQRKVRQVFDYLQDQITRRLQRKKKKKYYRVPKEKEELEHKGEELPLLDHKSQRSGKHKPEVDDDKDLV